MRGDVGAILGTPEGRQWAIDTLYRYEQATGDHLVPHTASEITDEALQDAFVKVTLGYLLPDQGSREASSALLNSPLGSLLHGYGEIYGAAARRAAQMETLDGEDNTDPAAALDKHLGLDQPPEAGAAPVTPASEASTDATPAPNAKENPDAVQPSGSAGQQDASASASGLQKILEHGEVSYGELQKLQLTEDEVAAVQKEFGGTTPSWTAEKVKETTGLGTDPEGLVRQPRADELRQKYPGLSDDEVAGQEACRRNALQAKILLFKKFGGKDFQRYRLAGALADLADVATLPLTIPSAAATPFVGPRIAEQIGAQTVRTTGNLVRAGAENLSADEALTHATDTATAVAGNLSKLKKFPKVTSAVVDMETGKTFVSTSLENEKLIQPAIIAPQLRATMPTESLHKWFVTNCAEFNAVNNALLNGAQVRNLAVGTVKTSSGVVYPACKNCSI